MGGCTAELCDVLCSWLQEQPTLDVLFFQEVHWGMGKTEAQWSIDGWTFYVSPDPGNRYAKESQLSFLIDWQGCRALHFASGYLDVYCRSGLSSLA